MGMDKFRCPICDDNRGIDPCGEVVDHLIVTRTAGNFFHVHGPLEDKGLMKKFIFYIGKEAGIEIEDEGSGGEAIPSSGR